ncbi:hypothetical protein IWQ61_010499 [Dispira simplex]|nr:hypothetical protein IWQ61_010499 [Dispira simplex]
MKLASFISLSVVATCLSGSVWATSDLYNPQVTKEFCDALFAEWEPETYYGFEEKTVIDNLRKYTGKEVSMADLSKLSDEVITGAAKVFLLDKQYLRKKIDKSHVALGTSVSLYRIYAWITPNRFTAFWPLNEEEDITEFKSGNIDKGDNYQYFGLYIPNRVENQASKFIEGCIN